MSTLPRSFGSGGRGHMTSGNPSRDGLGGAVSSASLPALPSASPWRRSPWGHGSGLRAAGSVLGRGCACLASRPPRPLQAQAPCHACVAGRGPPCRPASSRPGQSPEPGWGRPALEGEEGRLRKTGPGGRTALEPWGEGWGQRPWERSPAPERPRGPRWRAEEGGPGLRAHAGDGRLTRTPSWNPGPSPAPSGQPLSGAPVPRGQKGPHCPGASPEQVVC